MLHAYDQRFDVTRNLKYIFAKAARKPGVKIWEGKSEKKFTKRLERKKSQVPRHATCRNGNCMEMECGGRDRDFVGWSIQWPKNVL